MWNVPPNACSGVTLVAESRQAAQHQVHLHLRALNRIGGRPAEQSGEHRRRHVGQHVVGADPVLGRTVLITYFAIRVDRENLGVGDDVGTEPGRGGRQRAGDCPHSADRHVPVPGPPADEVIQEAHILDQRLVTGCGKRPDQRIGRHHTAYQVAVYRGGDRLPDRAIDQRAPGVRRRRIPRLRCAAAAPGCAAVPAASATAFRSRCGTCGRSRESPPRRRPRRRRRTCAVAR